MKSTFVVTMWSGGRAAKKWKSEERPVPLADGSGVEFISCATRLKVQLIGNISIEEYESGKEEIEMAFFHDSNPKGSDDAPVPPKLVRDNIQPLF